MLHLPSIAAAIVLIAMATACTQHNYGGWYNQTDSDVAMSGSPTIPLGGAAIFFFLSNRAGPPWVSFYTQASGEYMTA
ncbi:hypothetical protein LY76DRAFT_512454 [Colletotrichum caudatum]|nr:hypothetical protein LY76DRAFT_512454 [Colletotrichum caudatum]